MKDKFKQEADSLISLIEEIQARHGENIPIQVAEELSESLKRFIKEAKAMGAYLNVDESNSN